jgi:hypothetical protein
MHIHVECADGEAKFWIEPEVKLVQYHGVSLAQINAIQSQIEEHKDAIANAWHNHFGG